MLDYLWERGWDKEYGEWFGYLHRDGRLAQKATSLKARSIFPGKNGIAGLF